MVKLRDGTEVEDRRLGRLQHFDPRSKSFAVSEVLDSTAATGRSKTWRLNVRNDQGPDGACVGFGTGHRLAAAPVEVPHVDYALSMALYHEAKLLDPWPGEDYEGTAVLAGIKAAQARGHVSEYRWCFTLEDYVNAILTEGPVLVGTWWKDSMFEPQADGSLSTAGENAGGHCYILRGVDLKRRRFTMTNSWGRSWGRNGDAYISFTDWERDLMPEGEGAVLYEKRVNKGRPFVGSDSGGSTSSGGSGRTTANGLSLSHWWIRGR